MCSLNQLARSSQAACLFYCNPSLQLDLLLPEEEEEDEEGASGLDMAGPHQHEEPYAVWQLQPDALSPASVKGAPTKVKASSIANSTSSCTPRLPTALAQQPAVEYDSDDSNTGGDEIVKSCRSPGEAEALLHRALNMVSRPGIAVELATDTELSCYGIYAFVPAPLDSGV